MKRKFNRVKKQTAKKFYFILNRGFRFVVKPFSVFFRRIFEFGRINHVFGLIIIFILFSLAILPSFWSFVQTAKETQETSQILAIETKTEESIHLPIDQFTITQGFHLLHPGVDFAAVKGSPVYPIMDGTVEEVNHWKVAYGNHIVIDHGSGFKSLYAHLSKTEVKEGEKVTKDSIVGLIGSTGWSTGPHLHIQISEDNHWINPRTFFEGYFGKRLASTR